MLFNIVSYILLSIITIIVFIPLLITLFASFKYGKYIGGDFPLTPPRSLYLENYKIVFQTGKVFLGFKNSIILVVLSVITNSILGAMSAYVLSRFDFKLKKLVMLLFMLGMMIPTYVTEVARFGIIKELGLYNTILAPLAIYSAADILQLFIYMQFINSVPKSLDESAMIDGSNYFGIFVKIIIPLILPAFATMGIIKSVEIMNDMYIPFLYLPGESKRTMTTTLMAFCTSQSSVWANLSAAIIVVMLPTVLIYIFFQKYIFAGIVAGAVKE
jgi:multiple sugar transport system permease protein